MPILIIISIFYKSISISQIHYFKSPEAPFTLSPGARIRTFPHALHLARTPPPAYFRNVKKTAPTRQKAAHRWFRVSLSFMYHTANPAKTESVTTSWITFNWGRV